MGRDIFTETRDRRRALERRIGELAASPAPLVMSERVRGARPRPHVKTYLVSPCPSGTEPWRLTWFLNGMPAGHTGRLAYGDVLRAADDYGADVMAARPITPEAAVVLDLQPGEVG